MTLEIWVHKAAQIHKDGAQIGWTSVVYYPDQPVLFDQFEGDDITTVETNVVTQSADAIYKT